MYTKMVSCEWCGKRFMDDCGDSFCSSSCERAYENADKEECNDCEELFSPDELTSGLCDECWSKAEDNIEED